MVEILDYVTSRIEKDQFGCPYTDLLKNKARYLIAQYLDSKTGNVNRSGTIMRFNEYDGVVEQLYQELFEHESITISPANNCWGLSSERVYPRETIDLDKVNELLRKVLDNV